MAALAGAFNVLMMITANLVGFAIGVDGVKYMFGRILTLERKRFAIVYVCLKRSLEIPFLFGIIGVVYCAVILMFKIREDEEKRGIFLNC